MAVWGAEGMRLVSNERKTLFFASAFARENGAQLTRDPTDDWILHYCLNGK